MSTGTLGGGMFRPPSPINVYTARRPHKRWTFWRILRWTLAVVLMSGVTVGGAVAYYVWNRLERITTTNDPNLKAADKVLAPVVDAASQPAVALVLGYDKRYGSGNSRGHSDTLMLIRVDPKTKILSLLSLPRDLYVNVPGMGMRKINDAYAYGGAPLAIQTVSQVLGVKINYYVPVNFHLFRKTVDIFHGVYIDVDRRYYHANNSAGNYSAIDLQPGYQKLYGAQALQYVRYRHLDSDFIRTARQQAFVREFKRRLDVWSAGTNLFSLLDTLPNDLKVRGSAKGQSVGPKTILSYVKLLAEIPRGNMVQVRLTGSTPMINGASVVEVTPQSIQAAVTRVPEPEPGRLAGGREPHRRHAHGRQEARQEEAQGPEADPAREAPRRDRERLGRAERRHAGQGRAPEGRLAAHECRRDAAPDEPVLDAHLLHERASARLGREAAPFARRYDRLRAPARRDERLRARRRRRGRDRQRLLGRHPAAERGGEAGRAAAGTPARAVGLGLGSRRLLPAAEAGRVQAALPVQGAALLQLPRGHRERAPTRSASIRWASTARRWPSTRAPARPRRTPGGCATRPGSDAPILEQPTRQVCWDNHQVRVYTNGAAIHRIAVFYGGQACKAAGGVVVWIDNSLDDHLSPETMIAIARSMVPAHRAPA